MKWWADRKDPLAEIWSCLLPLIRRDVQPQPRPRRPPTRKRKAKAAKAPPQKQTKE